MQSFRDRFGVPTLETPRRFVPRAPKDTMGKKRWHEDKKLEFEGEIERLQLRLDADKQRRSSRSMDLQERKVIQARIGRAKSRLGESLKELKNIALKLQYNKEQKERALSGRKPFFVRDPTSKKGRSKFRFGEREPKGTTRRENSRRLAV
mmetsp:Transcript_15908/g.24764  ORF Transcript_15908/g.24764 Transcript_15908/m.24764 type:complete len:150 (+) Transcript_15908:157-606(+)